MTLRRLRVLVLASVRWYNAAAAYAVELASDLAAAGHTVRLVVKPGSPPEAEARRRGLAVESGFDLTATGPGAVFAGLRGLRALIRDFRPELVNAHRSEDHLLAAVALRGSGIPLVRTRGDVRPPRAHAANRILYRRATAAHVACADFMPGRYYPPLGIDPAAVRVIRPGVDPGLAAGAPDRDPARRALGLEPETPWVGLIGRFTAAKGHRVLIEALARVRPRNTPAPRLLLAGVANEITPEDLERWAREAGVAGRVQVAGRYRNPAAALRALDVLAVPSVASEAIARVALEGLALGVPTVASRLNSLPEIVGDAGLLVPPGDAEALAGALTRMLEDSGLRDRARTAGPDRIARRYDRASRLALTEALFAGLAGEARR